MKEFLLLMKGDDSFDASPEEMQQRMHDYRNWIKQMMDEGRFVAGQPLEATGAHLIKADQVLTDGPFLEPKEIIGGYIIIKATGLEEAINKSKTCPLLSHCEIYVRPLMNVQP